MYPGLDYGLPPKRSRLSPTRLSTYETPIKYLDEYANSTRASAYLGSGGRPLVPASR